MLKFVVSLYLLTALASSNIDYLENPLTVTVTVLKNNKPICLGVIVDIKYIATSAHCVFQHPASSLFIKTWTQDNKTITKDVSEVQRVLVHPYYTNIDYDIALLKIKPLQTESLPLGMTEPLPKDKVETIYWNPQNNTPPSLLPVKIEDRKSCKQKIGKLVSGRMICAYDENPSLRSDGPLIFNGTLIGIPSKRFESSQGVLPAIYTNIANSEIYSFIDSYV